MVCLIKQYHFKFLKGCLQKILIGPLLNALSHLIRKANESALKFLQTVPERY